MIEVEELVRSDRLVECSVRDVPCEHELVMRLKPSGRPGSQPSAFIMAGGRTEGEVVEERRS